jgi:hypothetical protein
VTRLFIYILILIQFSLATLAQVGLPKSINIASGIPLTFDENNLQTNGLKPHQETGGWGDVMANVAMAMDIKSQFPDMTVRLIVTLNDDDHRPYVNKVRKLIPNVMKDNNGKPYLNPDSKSLQHYNGIEIYFVNPPAVATIAYESQLKADKIKLIESTAAHIPYADLGVQFSANNSAFSNLIVKAKKLHVYFHEYEAVAESFVHGFFNAKVPVLKLNSGPLSFGVYGFGNKSEKVGSESNRAIVNEFLNPLGFDLSQIDLAFAYARDDELIEDYRKALEIIANEKEKSRDLVVIYKGSGEIIRTGRLVQIPIADHPFELNKALIAESTISPLITGDVSFSLALRSTTPTKSFLYEGYAWKQGTFFTLFKTLFSKQVDLMNFAFELFLPRTNVLENEGVSREDRVKSILDSLKNRKLHREIHKKMSLLDQRLNLSNNLMGIYRFESIFQAIYSGFQRDRMYSEKYLIWLTKWVEKLNAHDEIKQEIFDKLLTKNVIGSSEILLQKWFSLYTLWELGVAVDSVQVRRVLIETSDFLIRKETEAKMYLEMDLMQFLEQLTGSDKSRHKLYLVIQGNKEAQQAFRQVREAFQKQSSKKLLLKRSLVCRKSISPVAK